MRPIGPPCLPTVCDTFQGPVTPGMACPRQRKGNHLPSQGPVHATPTGPWRATHWQPLPGNPGTGSFLLSKQGPMSLPAEVKRKALWLLQAQTHFAVQVSSAHSKGESGLYRVARSAVVCPAIPSRALGRMGAGSCYAGGSPPGPGWRPCLRDKSNPSQTKTQ